MPGIRRLTPAKGAAIVLLVGTLFWFAFHVMRPPLPVTIQFRSAASGSGFVLIFKNDSDSALAFTATLEHQGQQEEKKFAIQVQPHSVYELETSQGWVAQSGDRISLTSSDYREWRGAIP